MDQRVPQTYRQSESNFENPPNQENEANNPTTQQRKQNKQEKNINQSNDQAVDGPSAKLQRRQFIMERTIRAKLGTGMDSCVRVLNLFRRKGLKPTSFSMEEDLMVISVADDKWSAMVANLKTLADVSVVL